MEKSGTPLLKRILGISKYPIALMILAYVLQQADHEQILHYAQQIPFYWIAIIMALFFVAQLFATMRMNYYYATIEKPIELRYSLILHYVALFYNVILPGGIGGDAYKVLLLKKVANYPARQGVRIQLLTRVNGLLVLLLMLYGFACFMPWPIEKWLVCSIAAALAIITTIGYFVCSKLLLKETFKVGLKALPYSFAVQGFNVLVMAGIWYAMGGQSHLVCYMFLFQVASIAGMIPITIGGLGVREFTFFYGTAWLAMWTGIPLDAELGVTISLLVFAVTLAHACSGLIWMGRIGKLKPCGGKAASLG